MKILIIGHGRHGKDTAAEILRDEFGISFSSSSKTAFDKFIHAALMDEYGDADECYNDRLKYRSLWYELICFYNRNDKTRLARNILKENDCYVGMRSMDELKACNEAKLFDLIIWIDASQRIPGSEGSDSMTINKSCADIIIENNGTKEEFYRKIVLLGKSIQKNEGSHKTAD